ncbi:MAG: hypothetical protein DHS80DRAFT_22585 [Piptocephalis tieghemiana]|nr:MAG: hypothetical protein DHS80DRAFT_22585 [Piptocephalis tieghemiana]
MSGASRKDSGERLTKKQRKAEAFRRGDRKRKRPEPSALPEMDVDESETSAAPLVKKGEKVEDKTEVKPKEGKRKEKSKAQPRFIVFAGNLPFNVSKEDLQGYFASAGEVKSVRLMTDRVTGKPKGFAFVEFTTSASLGHALHLHHTQFKGRQINVELTAGGGGKSEGRKTKLREKNEKLDLERQKHAERKEQEEGTKHASTEQNGAKKAARTSRGKKDTPSYASSYTPTGANAEQAGYGLKRKFTHDNE